MKAAQIIIPKNHPNPPERHEAEQNCPTII
jgi:hypothetical protein